MKKIILATLLSLPFMFLAQTTQKQPTADKIKLKQQEIKAREAEKEPKPTVVAGSRGYDLLKAKGKLAHYEVKQNANATKLITKTEYKPYYNITSTLTPCDVPPNGASEPFPTPVDDQTSALIQLPFSFCFYGQQYTECRMGTNGNIQFPPTNFTGFNSAGLPINTDKFLAPFWSDVDNRGVGQLLVDVFPTYAVFTWTTVGYYNSGINKTNSFMCVITDGIDAVLPPGKNVGFYYGDMQWGVGSASGGTNGNPPATGSYTPATVGANGGNGVDYVQVGRFGPAGSTYDGPGGNIDGRDWLDNKKFFFNLCPPLGSNLEPQPVLLGYCDTLNVCGNDTLFIKNTFTGPEVNQNVIITASAPTLGSAFSYSLLPNNGGSDIYMIVDASLAPAGYHTISMTATDDGIPAQTSLQTVVVFINHAAVNNLNGSIFLDPTTGACPGGVVSASVIVNGGSPDSYLWSNGLGTASTTFTTVVPADSLIFVTVSSGQCSKTIIGGININPVPVASISGNLAFCSGNASSTILTANNLLNPSTQGPHTYAWATSNGILSSTNTETVEVNAGTYSVTITNQFGCVSTAVTTVTTNLTPSYNITSANAIASNSVYCVGSDSAHLNINWFNKALNTCGITSTVCLNETNAVVGTATTDGSGGAYTPYEGGWESSKHQYLIRASELIAAGVKPGALNSLAFNVTDLNANSNTFDGFSIKLKCVTTASLNATAMDNIGLTQVYGPTNITANVGLNTYNFTQGYNWDGTSNLLVDVCFFNTAWDGNLSVEYTNVGYNASRNVNADNINQCPLNTVDGTSQNRPNMIFANCASIINSNINIVVSPTTGVVIQASNDNMSIALPTTPSTQCYTVSVINTQGNCNKDTVICVQTIQGTTQATLVANNYTVCPNQSVTLSALGALSSYTINYVGDAGAGTSVNSPVTFNAPTLDGAYVYTIEAIGQCGGPLTAFNNTVNVKSGVTIAQINTSNDSICPGSPVTLTVVGPILQTYTISYVDAASTTQTISGTSMLNNTVTVTPNVAATGDVQTYSLIAQGACGGPIDTFMVNVYPKIGTSFGALNINGSAASNQTVCPLTQVTLSAAGSLPTMKTYTISYDNGSGVQTSTNTVVFTLPAATSSLSTQVYTIAINGACNATTTVFTNTLTVMRGATSATPVATPSIACFGSNVNLSVQGVLPTLQSYTITYNNGAGNLTAINSGTNFISATTSLNNTYTVTAKGACDAAVETYIANYQVQQKINVPVNPLVNVTKCFNGSATLTAVSPTSVAMPYTYNWQPATSANTNSVFVAAQSGTYQVTVNGFCANPTTQTVVVNDFAHSPDVLIVNSATICAGTELMLNTTVVGGKGPYAYNWTILPSTSSIGSTSELNTIAPEASGDYTVMVVATDSCGFVDFDEQLITVLPPCTIEVPNVITANGDGVNDLFKIKNINYHPNSVLTIFDRWGRKVYENSNYDNTFKGDGLHDGTYFYVLDVPDDKKYNGYFSIITK